MKRKITILAMAALALLAIGSAAQATSVALVPNTLNVTPGSTVDISVFMDVSSPITMSAISTNILYDQDVFSFDDTSVVTKGGLLTHAWELYGAQTANLRVGGIILEDPWFEDLGAGTGSLFTFTLKVKDNAPAGASPLTWGVYDGFDNATAGFDYADKDFSDVMLLDSEMSGTSINVVPEPGSLMVLGTGLAGLAGFATRKRR